MTICSSPLEQYLTDVLDEAPDLLGRCFDVAVTSLQREDHQDHEVVVFDRSSKPWWDLLQNRGAWGRAYAQRLGEAFSQGSGEASGPVPLAPMVQTSGEVLLLDSEIDEALTSGRLLQELMPFVEQELAVLDARMSMLAGLDHPDAAENPLRPSVFVRVLRDLMLSVEPDPKVRTRWLRHLMPPLGQELRRLYQRLAVTLQGAAKQEGGYRVRLVDDPQAYRPPPPPSRDLLDIDLVNRRRSGSMAQESEADVDALPSMSAMALVESRVDPEALQSFLKQGGAVFNRAPSRDYYDQVQVELATLDQYASLPLLQEVVLLPDSGYQNLPSVDRPVRPVDIGSQLSRDTWGIYASAHERSRLLLELKSRVVSVAQAMGLDVVRKLVNQVARDPLLLAPVREAMVALEPALLRMAMAQPRFFNEDQHPARRLIESVAQRAFNYNDEFSPEFERFLQPVQKAFQALNASDKSDPSLFADALDDLRKRWNRQDRQDKTVRAQRLQALRFAEERQALADQISLDLSRHPDVADAPDVILDFLYGTWSLVIASSQLSQTSGQSDADAYRAVVASLLWSVRQDVIVRSPAQVFDLLPDMIQTLHRGLDMLGKTREETRTFFDALMLLHRPVLQLRRARARIEGVNSSQSPLEALPAQESVPMPLDETLAATPEHRLPQIAVEPWLDRGEVDAAGFVEEPSSDFAELTDIRHASPVRQASADLAELAELSTQDAERILAALREGDWVDLHSQGEWLRAELIWTNAQATLFMFTSRGGRTHSMSKRSCIKLICRRWLRPVDAHSVVMAAIQSITADRI